MRPSATTAAFAGCSAIRRRSADSPFPGMDSSLVRQGRRYVGILAARQSAWFEPRGTRRIALPASLPATEDEQLSAAWAARMPRPRRGHRIAWDCAVVLSQADGPGDRATTRWVRRSQLYPRTMSAAELSEHLLIGVVIMSGRFSRCTELPRGCGWSLVRDWHCRHQ